MVTPEFSHAVPLNEIGAGGLHRKLAADEGARAALVKRFDLIALEKLEGAADLRRDGESFLATGHLTADVVQACVASGEPVPAHIEEAFTIRFLPDSDHAPDAEIELDADDCDSMFHDGRVIDLGEALAQTLGLALPPFPRSVGAEAALKAAGVKGEDEAGPFGALAGLREKLGKS
jgi:uncharacterized metal-binding protein YceD (DUF177 family)